MKRFIIVLLAAAAALLPALLADPPAQAMTMTMNCIYTGMVVGHPGMHQICYVHHDDGSTEIFYAP